MKTLCLALATTGIALMAAGTSLGQEPPNPKIDYKGFKTLTTDLEKVRQEHLLSEQDFIKAAAEPGVIILDARSRNRYEQIHIKGAVHLAFTDFTAEDLAKVIPDKTTKVLIYCNNNFNGDPQNFRGKAPAVALNAQTFVNLHAYGYTNVYELGPLLDVNTTKIPFEGQSIK